MVEEWDDRPPDDSGSTSPDDEPEADIRATMIEVRDGDVEDIRRTVIPDWNEYHDSRASGPGPVGTDAGSPSAVPLSEKTRGFRPKFRPPMAVLIAVDDNQTTGEWRRIRSPRYMIGRTEGDMVIPHDIAMSQRHAEVRLVRKEDGFRWYLHDLKSSNGTFVLFDEVRLNKGDQLLVGSRRFLFDVPFCDPAEGPPVLIEIVRNGTGHRIELSGDEVLLGRDPNRCPAFLADDPLIEPEHARVCRNAATGRWHVQRLNSRNGTWYRVSKVRLCHGCWFLLGEQRFRFLMP